MGYKVQDTREMSKMSPAGHAKKVYRVWLVTDQGSSGQIDVTADKWNKDDLPGILEQKAAELDLAFLVSA